jgi:hypothetical protein
MAKGPILLFTVRRVWARRPSPSRSRARSGASTCAWRWRRARRGRHSRPSAHLRGRHAGAHHAGHEAGGHQEPGVPARRGRQARVVLPGRSVERAARGARSGAERLVHRSLPRRAVRPERGAVHRHVNFVQNIPGPLLDRMEVVDFSGYTEREKLEIAKTYLIPRQLEESGLGNRANLAFADDAVMKVITRVHARVGVRQLERSSARWPQGGAPRGHGRCGGACRHKVDTPKCVSCWVGPRCTRSARRARRGGHRHGHVLHAHGWRHHVRGSVDPARRHPVRRATDEASEVRVGRSRSSSPASSAT